MGLLIFPLHRVAVNKHISKSYVFFHEGILIQWKPSKYLKPFGSNLVNNLILPSDIDYLEIYFEYFPKNISFFSVKILLTKIMRPNIFLENSDPLANSKWALKTQTNGSTYKKSSLYVWTWFSFEFRGCKLGLWLWFRLILRYFQHFARSSW